MSVRQVYKAINAITAELSGAAIPKLHRNERDDYFYRSVDDVLNRLSPLLARHKLCVLPRVLERTSTDRTGEGDQVLSSVTLRVAFDLVGCVDGSCHTVEVFSEALDPSDKGTAKAMSSAYKYAMLQLFCVPVTQIDDADRMSHRIKRSRGHAREPVEGWAQWAAGIIDIARSCASAEALQRLQERQRALLTAISRERADLYSKIGAEFAKQAVTLDGEGCAKQTGPKPGANRPSSPRRDGEQCAKSHQPPIGEERASASDTTPRSAQKNKRAINGKTTEPA